MNLPEKFKSQIRQQGLFSANDKLLLAVSGGIDSVVLCELCKQASFDFSIAHCNFQLRREESERDENFVTALGKKYGVDVRTKKFETEKFAFDNKLSLQEAARKLRYEWFSELVASSNEHLFLLTAHHADDNIETLLMNFFRGTGLHGLTGIPVKNTYIRRPLLYFSKEDLLDFARKNNLQFVEDSSNQSVKYTRNYFRNELIPGIQQVFPEVKQNLADNIKRFSETESLYRLAVGNILDKLCRKTGEEIKIPVKQLMEYKNRTIIYEVISGYDFTEKQVDEVIKLASANSGSYLVSPGNKYRIIKHRHWFIISPVASKISENILIEKGCREIQFLSGKLKIDFIKSTSPGTDTSIAYLDAQKIQFPLLLRRWKPGDYFYPLGMKKKKKLSRFFIDLKLPLSEKEKIWVLESNQRIIWVLGLRIDDRFKITTSTKEVLRFSWLS